MPVSPGLVIFGSYIIWFWLVFSRTTAWSIRTDSRGDGDSTPAPARSVSFNAKGLPRPRSVGRNPSWDNTSFSMAIPPPLVVNAGAVQDTGMRSEEHTSELQSRGLISYAVF